ncbi:MAG: site-specific DNA-methyltransferase [Candidatus Kapaibacterium sp.]
MDGKSTDIVAEKLAQLRELFPEVFSEDKIDFQRLKQALGEDLFAKGEHYELSWAGKSEARKAVQMQTTATLIPDRKSSIDFDNAPNIFIEGENLEVLRVLQKSLFGKVKMIYIDPPYNTGNDSFVYPDDYTERQEEYNKRTGITDENGYLNKQDLWKKNTKENGQFHSVWLSMMFPRLYLSRNLLSEDGVIFISIDDNEASNLKLLCDEVFGEENFIGMFVVNASPSAIDYGPMGKMHEYALFYSKNSDKMTANQLQEINKEFKYVDDVSPFNLYPLYNGNVAFNPNTRPNLFYPFYLNPENHLTPEFYEIGLEPKDGWIPVYPVVSKKDGIQRVWRWGKDKARKNLNTEIVGYKTESDEYRIVQKTRLTGKVIRSLLIDKDVSSRRGTGEVEEIFGSKIFSFPKPIDLVKRFISVGTDDEDVVLDFFSGSGTTAHAVLELNEEDGGNRRFICVQMPEQTDENSEAFKAGYTTISEITKARITKVIEKLTKARTEKAEKQAGEMFTEDTTAQQPLSFAAYSLTESNFKIWRTDVQGKEAIANQLNAFQQSEIEGTEHERMFTELCLKSGLGLNIGYKEENGFFKTQKALWFCFVRYESSMKDEIVQSKPERVVFLNSCFQSDMELTNVQLELKEHGIDLVII